ncbi:MAG: hypothetical protein K0R18_343 [Bacillales bacterium]|jgi:hypothetical protein|nr:hypothetical protein [Bacillales bacterium]
MKITKISAHISDTKQHLKVEEFTGRVIKDSEGDYVEFRDANGKLQQVGCSTWDLGKIKTHSSSIGIGAWASIYIWTDNPIDGDYDIEKLKKDIVKAAVDVMSIQIEKAAKAYINMQELQRSIQ